MAGVHAGDLSIAARMGRYLSRLPGRWRWGIERLLRWWFAELAGLAARGAPAGDEKGTALQVGEDDLLEITARLTPETTGLAADRAALLIAERTPFAPADVLAGYRLDPDGQAVRLTIRLVPLARLDHADPAEFDAVVLQGAGAGMTVAVGIPPSPARRAARDAAARRRRVVMGAIAAAATIALLVPIALRERALDAERVQLEESRSVLQPALRRAAGARAGRDAATEARRLQARAPSAVVLLDRLSRVIDDDSYLTQLRLNDREVTIGGVSGAASALPRLIEADPAFEKVRLSAPVSRAADGRQRFEIGLEVARR